MSRKMRVAGVLLTLALFAVAGALDFLSRRVDAHLRETAQAVAKAAVGDDMAGMEFVVVESDMHCAGRDTPVISSATVPIPARKTPEEALREAAYLVADAGCREAGAGHVRRVEFIWPVGYGPSGAGGKEARARAEAELARRLPGAEIATWRYVSSPGWVRLTIFWEGRVAEAMAEEPYWLVPDRLRAGYAATVEANRRLGVASLSYDEAKRTLWLDAKTLLMGEDGK